MAFLGLTPHPHLPPQNYSPTVFERYSASRQMKGKAVHLQIWDTAGAWGACGGGAGAEQGPRDEPQLPPSEPGGSLKGSQGTGVGRGWGAPCLPPPLQDSPLSPGLSAFRNDLSWLPQPPSLALALLSALDLCLVPGSGPLSPGHAKAGAMQSSPRQRARFRADSEAPPTPVNPE